MKINNYFPPYPLPQPAANGVYTSAKFVTIYRKGRVAAYIKYVWDGQKGDACGAHSIFEATWGESATGPVHTERVESGIPFEKMIADQLLGLERTFQGVIDHHDRPMPNTEAALKAIRNMIAAIAPQPGQQATLF